MGNKQIEEKKRIIFTLSNDLLRKLDDASKEHGDCGRAVIIRIALNNFFAKKDY